MPRDAKDIIGEAALADLLKDYDVTPKPAPPEPKRLVTMEESRERFLRVKLAISGGYPRSTAERWWDEAQRDLSNDADSWLVRTVNRRIIEGLPRPNGGADAARWAELGAGSCNFALRTALLRTFCGEETP